MRKALYLTLALAASAAVTPVYADDPCMLGQIDWFAMSWAPKGYAPAQGQIIPISENEALYSLIGSTYGGDGRNTFALPDLRGRAPIGQGQGPGLPAYPWGMPVGMPEVTLTTDNLPPHTHAYTGQNITLSTQVADARGGPGVAAVTSVTPQPAPVTESTQATGSGQPVKNMQPSLAITPAICINGIYPQRN